MFACLYTHPGYFVMAPRVGQIENYFNRRITQRVFKIGVLLADQRRVNASNCASLISKAPTSFSSG